MDLQPSQNNYNEGDRLQTSESLSGFFCKMTVSNKIMERIMRQDSNLSPYDGFRIGGIGRVLNQIGLNQRKHRIIYKVSSGEFAIPMELTENVMELQLIPKEEILEELRKLMFDIHPRIAYNLADKDFSRVLTLHQDFRRKDLMKEGKSILRFLEFLRNLKVMTPDPIRIPRIGGVDTVIKDHPVLEQTLSTRTEFSSRISFLEDRITGYRGKEKEFIKIFTHQEIMVDNQLVIGRYEDILEIAGHEILVAGVAGKENGSMTLGLNFLEDHKPWGRKIEYFAAYIDSGSEICTAKPGVFPKEAMKILPVIAGRDFSQKILILNKGIREAKIMIRGAFGTPWQQGLIDSDSFYKESEEEINENPLAWWDRNKIEATLKVKEECKYEYVRYKPMQINMEDKKDMQMIIKEHINFGLIEPGVSTYSSPGFLIKMENESKKFTAFSTPQGQYTWNVMPMGLANAPQIFQRKMDNLFKDYFEFIEGLVLSEKEATIAVNKIEFLGILIDETCIELQDHIVEKIRNLPDVLKDKKHLQSFLGVVNFAGIFIKDLAKYRKHFRPLLKETESSKWKWEEIHTQRVRELKQICSNLPKLAIPQDDDKLIVYTDANDYRWAAVLMKKTVTGEEPCRYTGGHLRENLEELDREFGRLAVNAQVAGQIQRGHCPDCNKKFFGSINCAIERSTRTNSKGISLGDDSRIEGA
ncbi:UNVERIFIED_CONTAM: Enzymatic polyprotein [Sesamum latifolium]|uniref:Enzymatic polyprotein n=1 Tax=Sesamum latifolium TaxID=2727402 RepID=A0AAW2WT15_9LAMI